MLDQLRRVQFRWRLRPRRVIADTTYGTAENIGALEEVGIRAYVPLPDFEGRTPYFGSGRFTYAPADDAYRCPAGQPLRRRKAKYTEGVGGDVQRLRSKGGLHRERPRADRPPLHPRRRPRARARLPRDGGLQERHAQAQGLAGAALRRGQAVARPAPVPAARAAAGEHGGAAHRGGPEPQALVERDRLGVPSWPHGEPRGGLPAAPRASGPADRQ